nr:hypothetical protein [Pseudomonas fluorescens]
MGDRCRVPHADDPRTFGFDPAAVAQDQRQLLGVDGLVIQRERADGRVDEQLQGFELFCGQCVSGQCQVGGRLEMLTVQLQGSLFSRHRRAGSTLVPEGCPALAVRLYRIKRLQSFEHLQRGQGRQGVGLIQAGDCAVLIQRGLQCRVLQDEGAGLGKADKTLRLLIGGGKQQAGVLPVQVQLLFEPLFERVADARTVGHQLTQALAAFAPACRSLQKQAYVREEGHRGKGRYDSRHRKGAVEKQSVGHGNRARSGGAAVSTPCSSHLRQVRRGIGTT